MSKKARRMEQNPDHNFRAARDKERGRHKDPMDDTRKAAAWWLTSYVGHSDPNQLIKQIDGMMKCGWSFDKDGFTWRIVRITTHYGDNRLTIDLKGVGPRNIESRGTSVTLDLSSVTVGDDISVKIIELAFPPTAADRIAEIMKENGVVFNEATKRMVRTMAQAFENVNMVSMVSAEQVMTMMRSWNRQFGGVVIVEPQVQLPSVRYRKMFDDISGLRVVYIDGSDAYEETAALPVESMEEAWLMVDYLIGEDHYPVTIVNGTEVLAGRPEDEPGWGANDFEDYWSSPDNKVEIPKDLREPETTDHGSGISVQMNQPVTGQNTGFQFGVDVAGVKDATGVYYEET